MREKASRKGFLSESNYLGISKYRPRIAIIRSWLSRRDALKRLRTKLTWTHQDLCGCPHHAAGLIGVVNVAE